MSPLFNKMQWLLPGLSIKRWLLVVLVGALLTITGVALLFGLQPISGLVNLTKQIALIVPANISGTVALLLGAVLVYTGFQRSSRTVMVATGAKEPSLLNALYRKNKLSQGPRIVAIGGGTGLSTLLRGLKKYTNNITAIVTVGDDGGSSGRLRKEHGVIPPGDLRNCIAALADEEQLITELFQYRFATGDGLEGHSFGNLFITAMSQVTGDMLSAIRASSDVLNISGRVLPSTLAMVSLSAQMDTGELVHGESNIPNAKGNIHRMTSMPQDAAALPDAIDAIEQADIILMGPGSLYTSIIPNLLINEIAEAVARRLVPKVYVASMMSQCGETDNMTVADHVAAIQTHGGTLDVINTVLVNDEIPSHLLSRYQQAGCHQVERDDERCAAMGMTMVEGHLINEQALEAVRHNPVAVADCVLHWYRNEWLPANSPDFLWRHRVAPMLPAAFGILPSAAPMR